MKFRTLKESEIELRVARCTEKGSQWLLYKTARVDMEILDETVGALKWQRDHKEIHGVVYCGVAIQNDMDEWIWKWDAGSESFSDKQKGEASDSFKRACVNFGIGRELYSAPFIWISSEKIPVKLNKNSKYEPDIYDSDIRVQQIKSNNNEIYKLLIQYKDKTVYTFDNSPQDTLYVTELQMKDLLMLDTTKKLQDGYNALKAFGAEFMKEQNARIKTRKEELLKGETK